MKKRIVDLDKAAKLGQAATENWNKSPLRNALEAIAPGMEPKPGIRCRTGVEVIADIQERSRKALETYKTNGGLCQNCGKEKAEYPNGLNPFNCKTCNAEAEKIIQQLQGGPGFTEFRIR